jgi:hypothetical protein
MPPGDPATAQGLFWHASCQNPDKNGGFFERHVWHFRPIKAGHPDGGLLKNRSTRMDYLYSTRCHRVSLHTLLEVFQNPVYFTMEENQRQFLWLLSYYYLA